VRATPLQQPIDFGDSYAQVVLRSVVVGGVPLVGFFQMDKTTGGLRRIQLERQRHGVNPPAFRAVLGALEATYDAPDATCGIAPQQPVAIRRRPSGSGCATGGSSARSFATPRSRPLRAVSPVIPA